MVVTRSEQKLGEVFLHRDQQARRARGWRELVLEEGSGQGRAMAGEVGQADGPAQVRGLRSGLHGAGSS